MESKGKILNICENIMGYHVKHLGNLTLHTRIRQGVDT
jgi:hypothetical protein